MCTDVVTGSGELQASRLPENQLRRLTSNATLLTGASFFSAADALNGSTKR